MKVKMKMKGYFPKRLAELTAKDEMLDEGRRAQEEMIDRLQFLS